MGGTTVVVTVLWEVTVHDVYVVVHVVLISPSFVDATLVQHCVESGKGVACIRLAMRATIPVDMLKRCIATHEEAAA